MKNALLRRSIVFLACAAVMIGSLTAVATGLFAAPPEQSMTMAGSDGAMPCPCPDCPNKCPDMAFCYLSCFQLLGTQVEVNELRHAIFLARSELVNSEPLVGWNVPPPLPPPRV